MKIRVVRPKFPEFEGNVKKEKHGAWMKLSSFHGPVFISDNDVPNYPKGGLRNVTA